MLRVAKQISILLGASGVSAACGLVSLALNARGLGSRDFGILSLILAYSALVGGIAAFETWQPVIRLGVRAPRLLGLTLSAGVALDVSAALSAALLAVAGTYVLGSWTGVPEDHLALARIHALSLLFGVAATPKGYFRLAERFGILARNQMGLAVATLAASLALWAAEAQLVAYVVTFAAISALYNLLLLIRMVLAARRDGIRLSLPFSSSRGWRVLRLMIGGATGNSLLSTLVAGRRHLSVLIVGSLIGETAAGLFSVAARLASIVSRFSNLATQVLFKTVLQAAMETDPHVWRRRILRVTGFAAAAAVVLSLAGAAFGGLVIEIVFGAGFAAAGPVFVGLFAAECLGLASLHLNPVIQEKAGTRPIVLISAIALVVNIAGTVAFGGLLGVGGVGLAAFLAAALALVLMVLQADRLMRRALSNGGKAV